jgi:hypothetical protein
MRAGVPAIQKCMLNDAPITIEEFERAALHCSRWAARSRDVVRALVVDRESLSAVTPRVRIKPQQANVRRRRFLDSVPCAAVTKCRPGNSCDSGPRPA